MKTALCIGVFLVACGARIGAGRACGGGLVTVQGGTVGENAQRIFLAVHDDKTDVVTQIGVPDTQADYGVLIPVPGEPVLDPTPVASSEMDALVRRTAPAIFRGTSTGGDDSGCGCPVAGGSKSNTAGAPRGGDAGINVSQPVTIGPVVAVVLAGGTGEAINTWLSENGFAVPVADQPLVDSYAGLGRSFIAIRRGDSAPTAGATSVGVHFTLTGDQRALPLRFARLGAAAAVSFTVFVAAYAAAGPQIPFSGLTLDDLDATILKTSDYATAVAAAVAAHQNQAFIIEGTWAASELSADLGPSLQALFGPGQHLTRLSTILPVAALTSDVTFDQPVAATVPRQRFVSRHRRDDNQGGRVLSVALIAAAVSAVRRRPKK